MNEIKKSNRTFKVNRKEYHTLKNKNFLKWTIPILNKESIFILYNNIY